jgi:hypothetical protein
VKTADHPHIITILLSLSALVVILFSLQQSCSAQRTTKATSRAMLVFKSAQLTSFNLSEGRQGTRSNKVVLDFQVENVGKAIAHNPSLQYDLEVQPVSRKSGAFNKTWRYSYMGRVWRGHGTIKFMDDPPATPVVGEGEVEVPDGVLEAFPNTLTLHYRLSYDDEATGARFDEKESCGRFLVETSQIFPMLPCPPK